MIVWVVCVWIALTGGKVKSPIVLGNRVAESGEVVVEDIAIDLPNSPTKEYTIPTYPKPYFRGKNGGVYTYGHKMLKV